MVEAEEGLPRENFEAMTFVKEIVSPHFKLN